LASAGSLDPGRTAQGFIQQDLEAAKFKQDKDLANKPKVVPLADGAFTMLVYPDGSQQVVKNDQVASYLGGQQVAKFNNDIAKAVAIKKAEVEATSGKQDIRDASEARPQLAQTQQMLEGWKKAKDIVTNQAQNAPWMSKIQGAVPGVAGFFGGDEVAANKFLQQLAVDETLLNTAKTKGAISNEEMALFKSPIPTLSDDRERVWKPYIEARIPVVEKLMQFQQEQVARGENPAAKVGNSRFTVPGLSEGASKYFSK
jgi:hypothetical protein